MTRTIRPSRHRQRFLPPPESARPTPLRVLVSPARRTQETAAALECTFETLAAIAPPASAAALLAASGWNRPGGAQAVLLVGHQPGLGELAALLTTGKAAPWSVRKGALWWLVRRQRGGAIETVLRAIIPPDLA